MPAQALRVTVLLSGGGTTFAAIEKWSKKTGAAFVISDVVSDQPDAHGLVRANDAGCRTHSVPYRQFQSRRDFDEALLNTVAATQPDLVVLAGFMRIVAPGFVQAFEGRLLNIHPSLLPDYPGLNTYQRALDAGEQSHGTTVHFVNDVLDGGPLIAQAVVSVNAEETAASLASRVQLAERTLYPMVVGWFAQGRLSLSEGRVRLDNEFLSAPVRGTVDPETQEFERHESA